MTLKDKIKNDLLEEKAKMIIQRFCETQNGWPTSFNYSEAKRAAMMFVDLHVLESAPPINRVYWTKIKAKIEEL
jgi:hypothetical protein